MTTAVAPKWSRNETTVATTVAVATGQRLIIKLPDLSDQGVLLHLRDLLSAAKGGAEAYLLVGTGGEPKRIRLPFMVNPTKDLQDRLAKVVGEGSVSTT